MKNVKSLILLLLLSMAIFMTSCNNEVPEEMAIEVVPDEYAVATLDQVDYFTLNLVKYDTDSVEKLKNEQFVPYTELLPNYKLKKGEVLWLDDMEPGLYALSGNVCSSNGSILGSVKGKSDNMFYSTMQGRNIIIVEEDTPTVIKLVIEFIH